MIQPEIQVQVGSNLTTGARLRFGYDFSVVVGFTTSTSVLVETGSGSAFVLDSVVVVSGVELEVEGSVLVVEGTMTSDEGRSISGISESRSETRGNSTERLQT